MQSLTSSLRWEHRLARKPSLFRAQVDEKVSEVPLVEGSICLKYRVGGLYASMVPETVLYARAFADHG